jgi:hypothetical protein
MQFCSANAGTVALLYCWHDLAGSLANGQLLLSRCKSLVNNVLELAVPSGCGRDDSLYLSVIRVTCGFWSGWDAATPNNLLFIERVRLITYQTTV